MQVLSDGRIRRTKPEWEEIIDRFSKSGLPIAAFCDDNPFSEAQFKTLKYQPGFPGRLTGIGHATGHSRSFFPCYNTEHRHGGIRMLTPHDVHYGRGEEVLGQRQRIMDAACAAHPERFVQGVPQIRPLPEAVWINPPETSATGGTAP